MAQLKKLKNTEVRAPSITVVFQGGFLTGRVLSIPQPLPETYYVYKEQPLLLQVRPNTYPIPVPSTYYLKFRDNGQPYYQLDDKEARALAKQRYNPNIRRKI